MSASNDAFEYVLGLMRGNTRKQFQRRLPVEETLNAEVRYWEEHFMLLENTEHTLAPHAETWSKIEAALNPTSPAHNPKPSMRWRNWLLAGVSLACTLMFVLLLRSPIPAIPNTDYIAVLTDTAGEAKLTAMMVAADKNMWLQWEAMELKDERSLQLWAISRRDSQPRSIKVFEQTGAANLALSDAQWRLITDAEFLVLTQEEAGGSAIDEPSDEVLAKGFCVRYKKGNS